MEEEGEINEGEVAVLVVLEGMFFIKPYPVLLDLNVNDVDDVD